MSVLITTANVRLIKQTSKYFGKKIHFSKKIIHFVALNFKIEWFL